MPVKPIEIACLGDSLTNGRVSYNWIKQLSKEMEGFHFYNFGVDGDLAFNALERIDELIAVEPEYVFVLLGTNDVNGSMNNPMALEYYMKNKKLPKVPTLNWYRECMEEILHRIQTETKAEIIIVSLPILGEDLNHIANKKIAEYNEVLQELCKKHDIKYIDVHSKMVQFLETHPPLKPVPLLEEFSIMKKAILRRFFLFQDWDTISHKY
jgi:lysophospholipase L1-like esterase